MIFAHLCLCPTLRSVLRSGRNWRARPVGTVHTWLQKTLAGGSSVGAGQVGAPPLVLRKHRLSSPTGVRRIRRAIPGKQTVLAVPHQPLRRCTRGSTAQNGGSGCQWPTLQCVVLTGSPMLEAITTVKAEASSIVKPLWGRTGRQRHRSSLCGPADTPWPQKSCQNIL